MSLLWGSHSRHMAGLKLSYIHSKKSFTFPLLVMGFSGMVAQIILLRELLITFFGNELSIGIILANWLILEAIGSYFLGKIIEHIEDKVRLFITAQLIFSLSLPFALYLTRVIKVIFGFSPGQGVGALQMILFSLAILLPVSLSHGALFTFGCRLHLHLNNSESPSAGAGRVYILEILGTVLGGVAFTYALLPFFHSFQIAFGVVLLNLFVCLLLLKLLPKSGLSGKILSIFTLTLLCLAAYITFSGQVEILHWNSIKKQWGKLEVVYYENSPFGNIAVTKRENQYDFYSDGIPIITIPTPDIAFVEDFAHFPLLFHPEPEEVLVISGGAAGVIREISKHPVKRIDYAELDPLILRALDEFSPTSIKAEWQRPDVHIRYLDGRHYLNKTERKYDLILIGLSNPNDLQTNRFFTIEFFTLAKTRLKEQGILLINLPGSLTYLSEELKKLNGCIWKTLKDVYKYVKIIPGETNLFLASDTLDLAAVTADKLNQRLVHRKLEVNLITPFYINYRLDERRRSWFINSIKETGIRLNRDYRPSGVFYSLSLWNAQFSPRLQKLFSRLDELKTLPFIFLCLIFIFIFTAWLFSKNKLKISLSLCLVTTGFSGMLFDLVVVFAFQVVYGYIYHRIGLIITAFMMGTGLGGIVITLCMERIKRELHTFLSLEAGLILFSMLLPVIFLKIIPTWQEMGILFHFEALFYLLSLTGGILVGAEFPLAIKIFLKKSTNFSRSVGLLNALDLTGGWLGGILGGVLLLPILGLVQTCIVLVMLKLTAFILLIFSSKRY